MRAQVVIQHRSSFPRPISFKAGDVLKIGRGDSEYPGWVWVTTANGEQGWAPRQYIDISRYPVTAKKHYCAHELDVDVGDVVDVLDVMNGWVQAQSVSGEVGWIPFHSVG